MCFDRYMLIDKYNRVINYARISVTDRCNLRCYYCMPKDYRNFINSKDILTDEQILTLCKALISCGINNIRITGGEPLVRKNIISLLYQISRLDNLNSLSLSTNGVLLQKYAKDLTKCNLRSINVSLDSLDKDKVINNCTKDCLDQVLQGLASLKAYNFAQIKINMVIDKNVKLYDIERMIDFCQAKGYILRLIETMPFANINDFIDVHNFLPALINRYQLSPCEDKKGMGPASYYYNPTTNFILGLITPMSMHFCTTCNRLRVSCNGVLHTCLGNEGRIDLKSTLNKDLANIVQKIKEAVLLKPKEHLFLNHIHTNKSLKINNVMTITGG